MYRFLKVTQQTLARQNILPRSSFSLTNHYSTMEEAKKRVALLKNDPGNNAKLKLYGLFKQVCLKYATIKVIFRFLKMP